MYELGSHRSTIREIFEYGNQRAAIVGRENVLDFSLGNPNVPAPDEEIARRAEPQGIEHILVIVERRQHNDLDIRVRRLDQPRTLYAVYLGHADVHQHDIRLFAPHQFDGLTAVFRHADNGNIALCVQNKA